LWPVHFSLIIEGYNFCIKKERNYFFMSDESSFAAKKEKKKKSRRIKAVIACLVAVLIVGGAIFGFISLSKAAGSESTSKLTYQVSEVKSGEITTSISGSGTLAAKTSETVASQYAGTVVSVSKKVGDSVSAGEQIAVISSEELDAAIESVKSQISSVGIQLASTDETGSSKYIRSTVAGTVKCIQAVADDVVEDVLSNKGYLCVVSTDGIIIPITSSGLFSLI
jgi:biotin carboxyl carrier protein